MHSFLSVITLKNGNITGEINNAILSEADMQYNTIQYSAMQPSSVL